MRSPDEIKKGLRRCEDQSHCDWCSLIRECEEDDAAIAYITQLEQRLAQVERERDAAVVDLSNSCAYCKHVSGSVDELPCTECFHPKNNVIFAPITRTKFEWRGIGAENSK